MPKAELHCHSAYSKDCQTPLETIVSLCERRGIDCIALTDHNEIDGAAELRSLAPEWLTVIVGEEVASAEGDVIGLFLKERIPTRLPIEETIAAIHAQGGLALLPHPFDRLRREAVGPDVTARISGMIDFIETFNSRCLFPADNARAARFARDHGIPPFVGSDAHTPGEYGRSTCLMDTFADAASFKASLERASFRTRYASPLVHVRTKIDKMVRHHRKEG